jgi:hypothetical protein
MAVPANYATLIAEIDAIVDDFNLSIFQVFGGKPSNLVSLMQLIDLRYKLFEAGGGVGTIVLAVFKAVGDGTGYSIDDIIILRQTLPAAAEWYNATTGSVIATPDPADLGSVSSASNVSVLSSALPTGASTSALQSAIQANAGDDASKAIAVQGVTNGKAITVSAGTNLNTSALALESGGNLAEIADATGTDGGATPARVVLVAGNHDSIARPLRVNNQGHVLISATGRQVLENAIAVTPSVATTGGTTSVASSATSVQLLASNANRIFASFRNDSTAIAYIELGATATTSSVYRLDPQGFMSLDNYTGAISCIWASANGFMRVSEGV